MAEKSEGPVPSGDPRDEALAWFVRLESGDAEPADRAAFGAWLARDPAHRREYDRLARLWSDLDRVPDPRRASPGARSRRRFLALGATGAAVACTAALGGAVATSDWMGAWMGQIRTGTGERRMATLDDASLVEMDAGSALDIEFSPTERRVILVEGRARVTVAPDTGRPFVLAGGCGAVTASDATLVAHRRADRVVVATEAGTATLSVGDAPPLRLAAGECRAYGPDGPGPLLAGGLAAETAWRQGRLVFQNQPLDAVIADLNRYHPARILLWDQELASLRVDGSVDIGRPEIALNAIVRTLPLRTLRPFPGLVIIRSA